MGIGLATTHDSVHQHLSVNGFHIFTKNQWIVFRTDVTTVWYLKNVNIPTKVTGVRVWAKKVIAEEISVLPRSSEIPLQSAPFIHFFRCDWVVGGLYFGDSYATELSCLLKVFEYFEYRILMSTSLSFASTSNQFTSSQEENFTYDWTAAEKILRSWRMKRTKFKHIYADHGSTELKIFLEYVCRLLQKTRLRSNNSFWESKASMQIG